MALNNLVSMMIRIFFFYLEKKNLNWYFFIIKIWVGMPRQIFLILKTTVSHISIFHPTLNGVRNILTRGWKVEDQFDTVERLVTNLTQKPKVEDQNGI